MRRRGLADSLVDYGNRRARGHTDDHNAAEHEQHRVAAAEHGHRHHVAVAHGGERHHRPPHRVPERRDGRSRRIAFDEQCRQGDEVDEHDRVGECRSHDLRTDRRARLLGEPGELAHEIDDPHGPEDRNRDREQLQRMVHHPGQTLTFRSERDVHDVVERERQPGQDDPPEREEQHEGRQIGSERDHRHTDDEDAPEHQEGRTSDAVPAVRLSGGLDHADIQHECG